MKRKKIIPLVMAVLVITGVTLYFEVFRNISENGSSIKGSGTIEVTEVEIASKIAGRVRELPVEEGESVSSGALLVRLSYDELSARRLSALANLKNAEKNLSRIRMLHNSGSVSQKDFDNAVTAYRVAKANHDYIAETIQEAVIYSPITGTVLEKNLEIGELAFPGTPVLTLADLTKPWIKIYVREKKLGLVRLGQPVDITVDSYPEKIFRGKVVHIASRAEFTPRTIQTREERVKLVFAVKVMIDNSDGALKPGMPADAAIRLESGR